MSMPPLQNPKWWATTLIFAAVHFVALVAANFYCLDNYYDKPCPIDWLGKTLISPAHFFFPLLGNSSAGLFLLPLNSFLWGAVLAEPIRWFCGWPAWRFSLRTMLIVTTVIALLLTAASAMK
jgi:hypothetical protein